MCGLSSKYPAPKKTYAITTEAEVDAYLHVNVTYCTFTTVHKTLSLIVFNCEQFCFAVKVTNLREPYCMIKMNTVPQAERLGVHVAV